MLARNEFDLPALSQCMRRELKGTHLPAGDGSDYSPNLQESVKIHVP